jgi:TonB family protein
MRLTLAGLAVSLCAWAAVAQTTLEWIVLAPAGARFTARMPKQPTVSDESVGAGALKAAGQRYAATADDGTTLAVWVMKGSHGPTQLDAAAPRPTAAYVAAPQLDAVAELAWELLVTAEVERLKRSRNWFKRLDEIDHGMGYTREFALSGRPAREYRVWVEKTRGAVYVVADESGAYVVAALGPMAGEWMLRPFLDSFALQVVPPTPQLGGGNALPVAGVGPGRGTGTGTGTGLFGGGGGMGGGGIDYNRPFRPVEVTKKAVIKHKPEPGFTEPARKFGVTGVVRLRAILSKTGEVTNIHVVKYLPHGLTEKAINAAKQIRFTPAQKDGRAVAQYVVLEYNFNIY